MYIYIYICTYIFICVVVIIIPKTSQVRKLPRAKINTNKNIHQKFQGASSVG